MNLTYLNHIRRGGRIPIPSLKRGMKVAFVDPTGVVAHPEMWYAVTADYDPISDNARLITEDGAEWAIQENDELGWLAELTEDWRG